MLMLIVMLLLLLPLYLQQESVDIAGCNLFTKASVTLQGSGRDAQRRPWLWLKLGPAVR